MKKARILAFLLSVCFIASAFAACDRGSGSQEGTESNKTTENVTDSIINTDKDTAKSEESSEKQDDFATLYPTPQAIFTELSNRGYEGTFEEWVESLRGADGQNGKSAYDLAVEMGYNGTLQEWLDSLVGAAGEQGSKGEKGDTGAQGPKGEKGDTGAQGPKGEKGDTGAQGPKGEKGDTGAQGPEGEKGDTGAQGPKGDKGDTGATIEKIEYDEYGRLVITLTDGTVLDPVELPEKEEHVHNFCDWYSILLPDCSNNGLKLRFCPECSYTESQYIPALGHETVSFEAKAPICGAKGHDAYEECTRCDYTTHKEIAALEHEYDENGFCTLCHGSDKFAFAVPYPYKTDKYGHPIYDEYYVSYIGYKNLSDFIDMEELIIPAYIDGELVTSIGGNADYMGLGTLTFMDLTNLKTLVISDGISNIYWSAFENCTQLESITIPKSVKRINSYAFYNCPNIKEIIFEGTIEEWSAIIKGSDWATLSEDCVISCTDGKVEHTFSNWTVDIQPTCDEDGKQYSYCDCGCGTINWAPIAAIGHDIVNVNVNEEAGCISCGVVADKYCNNCGVYIDAEITGPLGHSLDESGSCTRCDAKIDDFWYRVVWDGSGNGEFWNLDPLIVGEVYLEEFSDVIMPTHIDGIPISQDLPGQLFCAQSIGALTIPEHYSFLPGEFAMKCSLIYVNIPSTVTYIGRDAFKYCSLLEIIHYNGTIEEWNAIDKYDGWDDFTGNYTVYCTDGTITK